MNIERYEMGSVTILRLDGNIDETGMDDLRLALMKCIQDDRCNVVVNMTNVKFVSYMGVGVLGELMPRRSVFQWFPVTPTISTSELVHPMPVR